MHSDIFISYASQDRDQARRLAQAFEALGWSVWWDRSIPAGQVFHQVIEQALAGARSVVVVWSDHAVRSNWVLEEAQEGLNRGVLIPVMFGPVNPPMGFRRVQVADLQDWKQATEDPQFQHLRQALEGLLGSPPHEPDLAPVAPGSAPAPEPDRPTVPETIAPADAASATESAHQARGSRLIRRRLRAAAGVAIILAVVVVAAITYHLNRAPGQAQQPGSSQPFSYTGPRISLLLGSAFASSHVPFADQLARYEDRLEVASDRRIMAVSTLPGKQLQVTELLARVRKGEFDAAWALPSQLVPDDPGFELLDGPPFNQAPDRYIGWLADTAGRAQLARLFGPLDIEAMVCGAVASRGDAWLTRSLAGTKELTGMKLAVPAGLPSRILETLGVRIAHLPVPELYNALQVGVVDGSAGQTPEFDLRLKLNEVTREYIHPGVLQPVTAVLLAVNRQAWDQLAAPARRVIRESCHQSALQELDESQRAAQSALGRLQQQGYAVSAWPPVLLDALRSAWRTVLQTAVASHPAEVTALAEALRWNWEQP